MKTAVLCVVLFAAAWALPKAENKPQVKRLYVDPLVNELPKDLIPRITNGVEAVPHSIPYQAYLIVTGPDGRWLCGGSLISPTHVLTAAHCVADAYSAYVYFGAHNLLEPESSRIYEESSTLIPHEDYDAETISNDIGLITLYRPVELNEYINVVALPSRGVTDDYEGVNARVSGWGRVAGDAETSPVLLEVNSTVISNEVCARVFSIVTDSQLCISGLGGVGSCNGDSGGPLVFENIQIGVVSYGAKNCPAGYPSGFTRITSYLDWLEEKTGLTF